MSRPRLSPPVMHYLPSLEAPPLCDVQGPYYASLEAARTTCPQCLRQMTPRISEKAFQAAVVKLATQHGWTCYHTHDSRRSPSGYPDLTLVHPERQVCVWAELKVPGGVVTLQQQWWLDVLGQVTRVEAHLWWPEDWARLQATLGG